MDKSRDGLFKAFGAFHAHPCGNDIFFQLNRGGAVVYELEYYRKEFRRKIYDGCFSRMNGPILDSLHREFITVTPACACAVLSVEVFDSVRAGTYHTES